MGCNAALVIEAARAIKASGLLPRRTIRFILFSGEEKRDGWVVGLCEGTSRGAGQVSRRGVIFDSGIGRVTGYSLGGRRDIEPAVRETIETVRGMDVDGHTYDASWGTDHFDFLLEGVPNLVANQRSRTTCRIITRPRTHLTRWTFAS